MDEAFARELQAALADLRAKVDSAFSALEAERDELAEALSNYLTAVSVQVGVDEAQYAAYEALDKLAKRKKGFRQ